MSDNMIEPTDSVDGTTAESARAEVEEQLPVWSLQGLQPALEALLILAEEALPTVVLAEAARAPEQLVNQALHELADFYDETARGFQLRNVGGGWRYATRPAHAELISRWVIEGQQNRLTQASQETLAVIAYMQPVSRSRVSAVRGVNVEGVVRTLLARDLIAEDGTDEVTGAATLRTTDYFLARLGLESLAELPDIAPHLPEASELEAELAALAHSVARPTGQQPVADDDESSTIREDGDQASIQTPDKEQPDE